MARLRTAFLLVLLSSASAWADNPTWQPLFDLDDLFPSYILSTATARAPNPPPNYIGDPFGLVGAEVKTDSPSTKIRVRIELDQIADQTDFETTLPNPGTYRIYPKIRYRYQRLAMVRQPETVNASMGSSMKTIRQLTASCGKP